jgi:hypothetical protein
MKNVFLIPTDKPSRLVKIKDNLFYTTTENIPRGVYQHLHITNNEVIKEGDWALDLCEDLGLKYQPFKVDKATLKYANQECKKIILTTDTELIADGVQGIDDEFLEWFVKNPSCESVEVYHQLHKDEPNPFELPKALPDDVFYKSLEGKQKTYWIGIVKWNDGTILTTQPFYEYDNGIKQWSSKFSYENSGKFEWIDYKKVEPESALNSERMYSEEEVHKIIKSYKNNLPKLYLKLFYTNWFQQFKK